MEFVIIACFFTMQDLSKKAKMYPKKYPSILVKVIIQGGLHLCLDK